MPRLIFLVVAALAVTRVAETFYLPILPLYARLLGASDIVMGVVVGIQWLGVYLAFNSMRDWVERIRSKRPLIVGLLLISLASFVSGMAFGIPDLALYRGLSGIGYGMLLLGALAYVKDISPSEHEDKALGILSFAVLAGEAIGPIAGGYISQSFSPPTLGYRSTFFAGGIIQVIAGFGALFLLPEMRKPSPLASRFDQDEKMTNPPSRNHALLAVGLLVFWMLVGWVVYLAIPIVGASHRLSLVNIGTPATPYYNSKESGGTIISGFGLGALVGTLATVPLMSRPNWRKPLAVVSLLGAGLLVALYFYLSHFPSALTMAFLSGLITAPLRWFTRPRDVSQGGTAEQLGLALGPIAGAIVWAFLGP